MTISSMGGLGADDPGDPRPPIDRRLLALALGQAAIRLVLGFVFIAAIMSLVPKHDDAGTSLGGFALPAVMAVAGIAVYAWFFRRQLRGVYKARYPTLRAIEALILVAAMFLAIFSMFYVYISALDPSSFSEPLDSFSAYYFSLTVLATVGFGDIAPNTVPARSVTMVQMALDIAFIAVIIKVMSSAARRALAQRHQAAHGESAEDAHG